MYVDADALAGDADTIGRAARSASEARDAINAAWRLAGSAFGSTPGSTALSDCCRVWVEGTNTIALFVDSLATYTQNIATAYGATDTTLAAHATAMYGADALPKDGTTYYVPRSHGGPVA